MAFRSAAGDAVTTAASPMWPIPRGRSESRDEWLASLGVFRGVWTGRPSQITFRRGVMKEW